jgi:hypothetical protein
MTRGNRSLIPNTATKMPTVKKSFFQYSSQVFKMDALTTALSKESETSIRAKITAIATRFSAFAQPPSLYPHHAAIRRQTNVKRKENLKYFKQNPSKIVLEFYPYFMLLLVMNGKPNALFIRFVIHLKYTFLQ